MKTTIAKQVKELATTFQPTITEVDVAFSFSFSADISTTRQSRCTKDERIQALEEALEEAVQDNSQLREDLAYLRKQHAGFEEAKGGKNGGGPPDDAGDHAARSGDAARLRKQVSQL